MDKVTEKEKKKELKKMKKERHVSYEEMYPTNHLFILTPKNPFRRLCVFVYNARVSKNYREKSVSLKK